MSLVSGFIIITMFLLCVILMQWIVVSPVVIFIFILMLFLIFIFFSPFLSETWRSGAHSYLHVVQAVQVANKNCQIHVVCYEWNSWNILNIWWNCNILGWYLVHVEFLAVVWVIHYLICYVLGIVCWLRNKYIQEWTELLQLSLLKTFLRIDVKILKPKFKRRWLTPNLDLEVHCALLAKIESMHYESIFLRIKRNTRIGFLFALVKWNHLMEFVSLAD